MLEERHGIGGLLTSWRRRFRGQEFSERYFHRLDSIVPLLDDVRIDLVSLRRGQNFLVLEYSVRWIVVELSENGFFDTAQDDARTRCAEKLIRRE